MKFSPREETPTVMCVGGDDHRRYLASQEGTQIMVDRRQRYQDPGPWADLIERAPTLKKDRDEAVALLGEAQQDIQWCGGSNDFAHGGQARVGWQKGPAVTLEKIRAYLKRLESE